MKPRPRPRGILLGFLPDGDERKPAFAGNPAFIPADGSHLVRMAQAGFPARGLELQNNMDQAHERDVERRCWVGVFGEPSPPADDLHLVQVQVSPDPLSPDALKLQNTLAKNAARDASRQRWHEVAGGFSIFEEPDPTADHPALRELLYFSAGLSLENPEKMNRLAVAIELTRGLALHTRLRKTLARRLGSGDPKIPAESQPTFHRLTVGRRAYVRKLIRLEWAALREILPQMTDAELRRVLALLRAIPGVSRAMLGAAAAALRDGNRGLARRLLLGAARLALVRQALAQQRGDPDARRTLDRERTNPPPPPVTPGRGAAAPPVGLRSLAWGSLLGSSERPSRLPASADHRGSVLI